MDGSYAERVAYRLKSWKGVRQERPPFKGKANRPHENKLCEGCKAGHCIKGGREVDRLIERLGGLGF